MHTTQWGSFIFIFIEDLHIKDLAKCFINSTVLGNWSTKAQSMVKIKVKIYYGQGQLNRRSANFKLDPRELIFRVRCVNVHEAFISFSKDQRGPSILLVLERECSSHMEFKEVSTNVWPTCSKSWVPLCLNRERGTYGADCKWCLKQQRGALKAITWIYYTKYHV